MKNRESKLWILLIGLCILILCVTFVVVKYKNDDRIEDENVTLNDVLIEKGIWTYLYSYYYTKDNDEYELESKEYDLNFYKDYVEVCISNNCEKSTYKIDNNILTIEKSDNFGGIYMIDYKDDTLILTKERQLGTTVVYFFGYPVG